MLDIVTLLPFLASFSTPIAIALYILLSLGIQGTAKAADLPNTWLAWIPFVRFKLLGEVGNSYRAKAGKNTNAALPKWMLITSILNFALPAVIGFFAFVTILGLFLSLILIGLPMLIAGFALLSITSTVLSISTGLFLALQLLALQPIFEAHDEARSSLYFVLSLVFNFAPAILLLVVSQKIASAAKQPAEDCPMADELTALAEATDAEKVYSL